MAVSRKSQARRFLLAEGGELFINPFVGGFTVDVFSADWETGDDPVYHASYPTLAEAEADAALWAKWPES